MAHLFPAPTALVIKEIKEAHEAYLHLCNLVGEQNVAIHTSVHRQGASRAEVAKFTKETRHEITQQYGEARFRNSPVVICTHRRWKDEYELGTDRGVRLCAGEPRDLIIVDEEPSLERVFVAQPENVAELASVLTDTVLNGEARDYGFHNEHHAARVLRDVAHRMGIAKDQINIASLLGQQDLIEPQEAELIRSLTREDVLKRLTHLPELERMHRADDLDRVREFLNAACEGRVFYAKQANGGQFFAYSYAVAAQRNTIILDGTADLNGLYSVGSSVVTLDAPKANYENTQLHYLPLPKEFSGYTYWDPKNIRKARETRPFMEWFRTKLLENTTEGESILVYCPMVFIDTDLHKLIDDESGSESPDYCEWEGRKIHWCNFGAGRGTNRYKDCTVFFQIRAFFKPKAVTVATTASHTKVTLSDRQLQKLSSGKTRDPEYLQVRDTLIACDTKQNATRTCIRMLDDSGKAKSGRLYFVGDDLTQVTDYQTEMFPGARPVRVLVDNKQPDLESSTGPERLAHLLLTTEEERLSRKELADQSAIQIANLGSALRSKNVRAALAARCWSFKTRNALGMSGKGKVLVR